MENAYKEIPWTQFPRSFGSKFNEILHYIQYFFMHGNKIQKFK